MIHHLSIHDVNILASVDALVIDSSFDFKKGDLLEIGGYWARIFSVESVTNWGRFCTVTKVKDVGKKSLRKGLTFRTDDRPANPAEL